MTPLVAFTVPGDVVRWRRAGRNGKFTYTPTPQRNYMACVKDLGMQAMAGRPPFDQPLALTITATYLRPKSAPKRRPPVWKVSAPDCSNILKLPEDALNGVVWRDDALICSVTVTKRYGDMPGLRIEAFALEAA